MTLPATPTNGSSLFVAFFTTAGTINHVSGITLTGAAYTQISGSAVTDGCNIETWEAPNVTGSSTALSFTFGTSQTWLAVAWELPGVTTSSNIDGTTTNHGTSGSSPLTAAMTSSVLTQQVEALFVVTACTASISGATVATPAGYTRLLSSGSGTTQLGVDYKIFADTVAAQSVTASVSGGSTLHTCTSFFGVLSLPNQLAARNGNFISGTAATGSFTITLPKTPLQGNDVFVAAESLTTAGAVTGVSASGISFTRDVNENSVAPDVEIWRGEVTGVSPGSVITVTGGAVDTVAGAQEFFGVLANGLDKSTTNSGTGTTISTGTTAATTAADELVIAAMARSVAQTTSGLTAGYTSVFDTVGTGSGLRMAYKIVAATGTQVCSCTMVPSLPWAGAIATYKQGIGNSGASNEQNTMLMMGIGV